MEELVVCLLAGLLAGVGTGFAGLSAASFIAPLLVGFLDMPAYEATGIALFSDVLASALSALVYRKSGNMKLRPALPLMGIILVSACIGSVLAYKLSVSDLGNNFLGYWSIVAALWLGVDFLLHPVRRSRKKDWTGGKAGLPVTILCGLYIGAVCGFQGIGGGLMILFALTFVMGYPYKSAVGTSVFIMTFTALIGGTAHFAANGMPRLSTLGICCLSTAVFALVSARIANKKSERFLGICIGCMLTVSAAGMLILKLLR